MDTLKIVQNLTYVMDMQAEKYAFYTFGESNKQPFCAEKHSPTNFKPEIIVLEEDRKVAWCGYKHSSKGKFYDRQHKI